MVMLRVLFIVGLSALLLGGCVPPETQESCMDIGQFEHLGQCTDWDDIPEDGKEEVIFEIATDIAEEHDISLKEALYLMNQSMDILQE
jgi:hypothetical protein